MLQGDDLDVLVAGQVDAANDADHPRHVAGPVRDDQHVGSRMRREVAELRDQGPQNRHELCGAHVLDLDHLGDDIVVAGGAAGSHRRAVLARGGVRDDLDDVAALHCRKLMHFQNGQECLVERVGRHRRLRQHRYLGIHPRVDDEVPVRHRADGLDDLPNIRFLVIRCDGHLLREQRYRDHDQRQHRYAEPAQHLYCLVIHSVSSSPRLS